jgi:hypothetical protein
LKLESGAVKASKLMPANQTEDRGFANMVVSATKARKTKRLSVCALVSSRGDFRFFFFVGLFAL